MPTERMGIVYLRLSKEDGDAGESCSIASQRACIRRFLEEEGLDVCSFREIVDDGASGTSMDRPGMRSLLQLVEAGKVGTVVVRDLSRFARNYIEAGRYLELVFPLYNVRFISVNDRFDTRALDGGTGGLELAVRNLLNQMYSRDLSRKIRSAVDLKKLGGEYAFGAVPYGYKKGEKKNSIVVDRPAAAVVRKIFAWAEQGVPITQIARRLNESGTATPSAYLAAVRGRYRVQPVWNYESVRNILENRTYTGDTVPFRSHVCKVGSGRLRPVPEAERQLIPNTHEGIVSRETFARARAAVRSKRKSPPTAQAGPFTSLLVCGCCGKRLTKGRPQSRYWLCGTRRYAPDSGCARVRADEEKLKKVVLRALNAQMQLLEAELPRAGRGKGELGKLRAECISLRRRIERKEEEKLRLYEQYAGGQLSREEFSAAKAALTKDAEPMKLKLELLEKELEKGARGEQAAPETDTRCRPVQTLTPALTHEMIRRIVIGEEGELRIEWNFRDEMGKLLSLY